MRNLYDSQSRISLLQTLGDEEKHRTGRPGGHVLCSFVDPHSALTSQGLVGLAAPGETVGLAPEHYFHDGQWQYWLFPRDPEGGRPGGARAGGKGPGGSAWLQQLVCKHQWHILLGTPWNSWRTLRSSSDPVVTFVILTSKGSIAWLYIVWENWTCYN